MLGTSGNQRSIRCRLSRSIHESGGIVSRRTRRDWPRGMVAANAAVGMLSAANPTPEAVIERASKRAGSSAHNDDHMVPLQLLLEDISRSALPPLPRRLAIRMVEDRLTNKFEIDTTLSEHPQILEQEIVAPIVILGLPRTGTTLLHRLLARDPAHRGPLTWEMDKPCPPPDPALPNDPRIRRAAMQYRFLDYALPGHNTIHEIDPREPEECVWLMANELTSTWFASMGSLPAYFAWFYSLDLGNLYARHRRQLQLLQWNWRDQPRRWVLKAPEHLYGLEALLSTYPDALIIQTHRDPREVVPSLASLIATARRGMYRTVDTGEIGHESLAMLERWANAGMSTRRRWNPKVIDIAYDSLVRDPLREVEDVYKEFGLPLSTEAHASMVSYLEDHPAKRFGEHRYTLGQFALTSDMVEGCFADYVSEFDAYLHE